MPTALISIITVVFNDAATLEQTILSVLSQPYPNKEYLIIDGGSTDGSVDIIKKYAPQLAYWVSEPDRGVYDAMNKGIALAKGDLIGIINANDWYEATVFDTIAERYETTGPNKVIHGLLRILLDEEFYSMVGNSTRALQNQEIQHPTCFVPKNLYNTLGVFDLKYNYSADYDLMLRYANQGVKFSFIEKPIANFRKGGMSNTLNADIEKYRVRIKHGIISKTEGMLRVALIKMRALLKLHRRGA